LLPLSVQTYCLAGAAGSEIMIRLDIESEYCARRASLRQMLSVGGRKHRPRARNDRINPMASGCSARAKDQPRGCTSARVTVDAQGIAKLN
jgi:hypothetical protein